MEFLPALTRYITSAIRVLPEASCKKSPNDAGCGGESVPSQTPSHFCLHVVVGKVSLIRPADFRVVSPHLGMRACHVHDLFASIYEP